MHITDYKCFFSRRVFSFSFFPDSWPCVCFAAPARTTLLKLSLPNSLTWHLQYWKNCPFKIMFNNVTQRRNNTGECNNNPVTHHLTSLYHTVGGMQEGCTNYSCTDVTGEPLQGLIMKSITQEHRFVLRKCSFMAPNLRPCCLRPCRICNCFGVIVIVRLLLHWLQ